MLWHSCNYDLFWANGRIQNRSNFRTSCLLKRCFRWSLDPNLEQISFIPSLKASKKQTSKQTERIMILQNRLKLIVISKTVPFYISTYIYFFTYYFFLVLLEPSGLFAKEINCKRNKSNLVELCISISGEIEFTPWYSQIAIYSVGKLDLRDFFCR